MTEKSYLDDEELMRLIADAEASPVMQAPPYLKEQILRQAAKTKTTHIVMSSIPKKHELFLFSARVVAAAAAAIALLVVMPGVSQMEQMQRMESAAMANTDTNHNEEKGSVFRIINDKTSQLFRLVSNKTDAIFFKEDF